jgi:hypothetical protein
MYVKYENPNRTSEGPLLVNPHSMAVGLFGRRKLLTTLNWLEKKLVTLSARPRNNSGGEKEKEEDSQNIYFFQYFPLFFCCS